MDTFLPRDKLNLISNIKKCTDNKIVYEKLINFQPKAAKYETLTDLFRNIQKEQQIKKAQENQNKTGFRSAKDLLEDKVNRNSFENVDSDKSDKLSEHQVSYTSQTLDIPQSGKDVIEQELTRDVSYETVEKPKYNLFTTAKDLLYEQENSSNSDKKITDFFNTGSKELVTYTKNMSKSSNFKSLFGDSDDENEKSPRRDTSRTDRDRRVRDRDSSSRHDRGKERDTYRDSKDRDRHREDRYREERYRESRHRDERYTRDSRQRHGRDRKRRHSSDREKDEEKKKRKEDRKKDDRWQDDSREDNSLKNRSQENEKNEKKNGKVDNSSEETEIAYDERSSTASQGGSFTEENNESVAKKSDNSGYFEKCKDSDKDLDKSTSNSPKHTEMEVGEVESIENDNSDLIHNPDVDRSSSFNFTESFNERSEDNISDSQLKENENIPSTCMQARIFDNNETDTNRESSIPSTGNSFPKQESIVSQEEKLKEEIPKDMKQEEKNIPKANGGSSSNDISEIKNVKNKLKKTEIGMLVVKLLTPAYVDKRFESRDVFKSMARKISHSLAEKDEDEIKDYVKRFLNRNLEINSRTAI